MESEVHLWPLQALLWQEAQAGLTTIPLSHLTVLSCSAGSNLYAITPSYPEHGIPFLITTDHSYSHAKLWPTGWTMSKISNMAEEWSWETPPNGWIGVKLKAETAPWSPEMSNKKVYFYHTVMHPHIWGRRVANSGLLVGWGETIEALGTLPQLPDLQWTW